MMSTHGTNTTVLHFHIQLATEEGEDSVEMNEIRTWSDYNRVYFHPKSMVNISGYQMDREFMPFDVFSYGRAAFLETEKVPTVSVLLSSLCARIVGLTFGLTRLVSFLL